MSDIERLKRQLRSLGSEQTLADLHNLAGRDIAELVQAGFAGEHDPDGHFWVPSHAAQREGRKTLRDTGALQDGIRWKADSRGVVIRTTGKANRYALFVQKGTRPGTRAVAKSGRFRSKKSTARLKTSVGVRYLPGNPPRPFLPEGDIPLPYEQKLTVTFRKYFRDRFGSG